MKIIFLDIDGVFCFGFEDEQGKTRFEEPQIQNLKQILEQTSAKIVISSSMRKETIYKAFERFDLPLPIDFTPTWYGKPREGWNPRDEEISQWVKEHPEIDDWVMIDDDFLHLDPARFFRTFWYKDLVAYRIANNIEDHENIPQDLLEKIGLTKEITERIISYLNNKDRNVD